MKRIIRTEEQIMGILHEHWAGAKCANLCRKRGMPGRREYVQVLRLLETFEMTDLQVAVKNALRLGAIGFDAVKHLVLCQIEKRPPKLDLDVYPYLPKANVGTTSAASYMSLMQRGKAA